MSPSSRMVIVWDWMPNIPTPSGRSPSRDRVTSSTSSDTASSIATTPKTALVSPAGKVRESGAKISSLAPVAASDNVTGCGSGWLNSTPRNISAPSFIFELNFVNPTTDAGSMMVTAWVRVPNFTPWGRWPRRARVIVFPSSKTPSYSAIKFTTLLVSPSAKVRERG